MDLASIKHILHIEDDKPTRAAVSNWVRTNISHAVLVSVSSKAELDQLIDSQPAQDIQLILVDSQIPGELNVVDAYMPILRSAIRGRAFHRAAVLLCSGDSNRVFRFGNPPWIQGRMDANRIRRELGNSIAKCSLPSDEEIRQLQRLLNPAELAEAFQNLMIHKVLTPLQAFAWLQESGSPAPFPTFNRDIDDFRNTHLLPVDNTWRHPLASDVDAEMNECFEQALALAGTHADSTQPKFDVDVFYNDMSRLCDWFLSVSEKLEDQL